ncbi:unnamed protein product [Rotaria socialis]|uniref:Protein phosphatase n=2 Tax=Rotaria socialis TaxID=392032 RepID=A0A817RHW7_9BILA|nr:unnamed protein product [Rotaria socialis]CAF3498524.1 unnamed protein product [Rotaria socialis]CAF3784785.1 unnamed protein product [Rotaria socialis]CAF4412804.1 unnamed protein product [Rotaria socialis]CAF4510764.1 unnamed protein product [Rotaria socialis]
MLESSSVYISLKCGWHGISKQGINKTNCDQSKLEEEIILLSGPYGDDVAFVKQSNDYILIGLSDGVSGNRHHGLDPYKFAHTLISSCLEETDRIIGSSSMRGLVHRAIRCVEKRSIFGSATLCLLSIDKHSSYLRSLNIGDSGFMLIRQNKLIIRSHPQYHRGSSPFQLSSLPTTQSFTSNTTRLYHDKPSDGEYIEHNLEIGDLLLIASDGLFDNLYEDFIVQIINNHLDDQCSVESLQNVCQMLVKSACHAHIKCDDILVLLFCVVPCSSISIDEINENRKSTSCSSSDSSLSSILVNQSEEESFDLFIFKDSN